MPMPIISMPCPTCCSGSASGRSSCRGPSWPRGRGSRKTCWRRPSGPACRCGRAGPALWEVYRLPPGCETGPGRRLLLTGDLEGPALAAFNASGPGECDVLVAPHHGTRTSLPADIARVTKPGLVLVSGRGGRAWPEVREDYAKATVGGAAAVLKTGGEGALAVTLTAAGIGVERFSAGCWGPPADAAQAVAARDGLVNSQPAASSTSWLATYAPSRSNTPVVKP